MSPDEKLVYMANQIGKFFAAQGGDDAAVEGIATHLRKFWTVPMRAQIVAQLKQGAPGLDELPRRAVERLASGG